MVKIRPLLRVKFPALAATQRNAPNPIEAKVSADSATGYKRGVKPQAATGYKAVAEPVKKAKERPPSVTGYHWRSDGAGWELRRTIFIEGRRTHRYVGHLSKSAYREMKRQHKGAGFAEALADWIAEKVKG